MPSFDLNSTTTMGLVSEGVVPDLSDLAEEASQGAWKPGWYRAAIVEGYATRRGIQKLTEDVASNAGDSRNLRLCFALTSGTDTRNLQQQYNYRTEDFTTERLAAIKEARAEFKGVSGKWPGGASDLQRSSLAIAKLGQIQKAVGFQLKTTDQGLDPTPFIGQSVDVRLAIDENGYNEVVEFAKAGTKVFGKK